jgi:hypothetical protein
MLARFAGLLFVQILAPGGAFAQTADRPEVRVGDQWKFAAYYAVPSAVPNRVWRITAVGPLELAGTEDGEPLRLTRDLNVLESPRTRESNPGLLSFPLTVGKRWQFKTDWEFKPKNSRGTYTAKVEVVAYEKVTVPAGEFDAFRLTSREALGGTSPIGTRYEGETTRTYWYAPAARAIVKSVSHSPYLGPSTVELVQMERGP